MHEDTVHNVLNRKELGQGHAPSLLFPITFTTACFSPLSNKPLYFEWVKGLIPSPSKPPWLNYFWKGPQTCTLLTFKAIPQSRPNAVKSIDNMQSLPLSIIFSIEALGQRGGSASKGTCCIRLETWVWFQNPCKGIRKEPASWNYSLKWSTYRNNVKGKI